MCVCVCVCVCLYVCECLFVAVLVYERERCVCVCVYMFVRERMWDWKWECEEECVTEEEKYFWVCVCERGNNINLGSCLFVSISMIATQWRHTDFLFAHNVFSHKFFKWLFLPSLSLWHLLAFDFFPRLTSKKSSWANPII